MPTVLLIGPYRFFFYANENGEPCHIHVQRDCSLAKFWLEPVALVDSVGFSTHEQNEIFNLVETNKQLFLESWNEFFKS